MTFDPILRKKLVKKIIIAALIILGVSAIVSFSALASAGFNINELDRQHSIERVENVTGSEISTVKITLGEYDVKILATEAQDISVKAFDGNDVKTSITTEGSTLSIHIDDSRSWYDKMVGSIGHERELAVYLPKNRCLLSHNKLEKRRCGH